MGFYKLTVIRFRQGSFISTYTDELDAPNFKIEKSTNTMVKVTPGIQE